MKKIYINILLGALYLTTQGSVNQYRQKMQLILEQAPSKYKVARLCALRNQELLRDWLDIVEPRVNNRVPRTAKQYINWMSDALDADRFKDNYEAVMLSRDYLAISAVIREETNKIRCARREQRARQPAAPAAGVA